MKASIIAIGNSKGVRLPKPLLEESGLSGDVEIKASKGVIKIVAAKPAKVAVNEEYAASLTSLSEWNDPAEEAAWAHLQ